MKVVSSDNDWEELTENWDRRLISLICCIFLLLPSAFCPRISREGAGLAGTPPHLSGGCQPTGKAVSSLRRDSMGKLSVLFEGRQEGLLLICPGDTWREDEFICCLEGNAANWV